MILAYMHCWRIQRITSMRSIKHAFFGSFIDYPLCLQPSQRQSKAHKTSSTRGLPNWTASGRASSVISSPWWVLAEIRAWRRGILHRAEVIEFAIVRSGHAGGKIEHRVSALFRRDVTLIATQVGLSILPTRSVSTNQIEECSDVLKCLHLVRLAQR